MGHCLGLQQSIILVFLHNIILLIILANNPVIGVEIYCAHNILFILYIYNLLALT